MISAVPVIRIEQALKRHESPGGAFELQIPAMGLSAGEVCVVAGSSGCGKTTLLDVLGCISRFTRCKRFELYNEGKTLPLHRMSGRRLADLRRHHIGYILQQGGLLPYLTAWENILLPLQMAGKLHFRQEAHRLAAQLGVADLLNKRPAELSIGQRQRMCIIRALAGRPSLLLADEPTGALDPVSAAEVRAELLYAARATNATTVIVTHDVALFRPVADRLLGFTVSRTGNTICSVLHEEAAPLLQEGRTQR